MARLHPLRGVAWEELVLSPHLVLGIIPITFQVLRVGTNVLTCVPRDGKENQIVEWAFLPRCKSILEYEGGSQGRSPTPAFGLAFGWRSMGDLVNTPECAKLVERSGGLVGPRVY